MKKEKKIAIDKTVKTSEPKVSCISFLKNKDQRIDWLILALSCLVGYIAIRICYPSPATMSDSATYVNAAATNVFSFYRPFGYSYFLQIIHAISSNIHAVTFVQILLYWVSVASFSFVIKLFFEPASRIWWYVLLFFFAFSPMAFYMVNAIMSDLMFAVMIYFMLATFIYFFKTGSWISLCILFAALFCTLHLRYSALIFPVTFIICFLFMKDYKRWIAIGGISFATLIFYTQVKDNMREQTGFDQFSSGFDGWQLANNGLHVVPFIDLDPNRIVDPQMRDLHKFVLTHKDAIYEKTEKGTNPSAHFMWHNNLPLKQYMSMYMQASQQPYGTTWVYLGSGLYKNYGNYLIRNYPLQFMKHFYLPNSTQVFYPSKTEFITYYTPIDSKDIMDWYKISPDADLNPKYPIYKNFVGMGISIVYAITWLVIFALGIFSIIKRKQLVWLNGEKVIFGSLVFIGIVYYAATVYASPIALRFWIPMNAIQFAVIYMLSNRIASWRLRHLQ